MSYPADALTRHPRTRQTISAVALLAVFAVAACDSTTTTATGTPTASGIGMLGGSAQAATNGSALAAPLIVHVTDQYGISIANIPVTFTSTGGSALSATTVNTDTAGDAQVTLTLGTVAGVDTVVAAYAGATVPVRFFESSLAGTATAIAILSGNSQAGVSGTALPLPFVVVVTDIHGNPVPGDTLTWGANMGTLASPTSVTGIDGSASNVFTPALGTDSVTATVNGTALSKIFVATGS